MASLVMEFTEREVPASFRWREPVSDEEFRAFSERNRLFRFERTREGEITMMTPVGGTGGMHELHVSAALFLWNAEQQLGVVFPPNVGFNLPDGSCLAPDAAWIRKELWEGLTPREQAGFLPFCPEFLVEVRSQSDSRQAVEAKMALWMENGAKLAWLVDPIAGEVIVYRPGEQTETLERPDVVRGHAPIEGFELKATRLWSR